MEIDEEYMTRAQEYYKVFCPKCGNRARLAPKENDGCVPTEFHCDSCSVAIAALNLTDEGMQSFVVYRRG